MFTRDGVKLRPLEPGDAEVMYAWHLDYSLDILSAWERPKSLALYQKRLEDRVMEPPDDMDRFGIEYEGASWGRFRSP